MATAWRRPPAVAGIRVLLSRRQPGFRGLGVLLFADWSQVPNGALEWGVLLWLGLGASGLGYLGWNVATKWVNTGQLATMNNMLIPAGVLVNVLFWNRDTDWPRLLVGGSVIGLSVWLCRQRINREI